MAVFSSTLILAVSAASVAHAVALSRPAVAAGKVKIVSPPAGAASVTREST
jgi:hypothetical protein